MNLVYIKNVILSNLEGGCRLFLYNYTILTYIVNMCYNAFILTFVIISPGDCPVRKGYKAGVIKIVKNV